MLVKPSAGTEGVGEVVSDEPLLFAVAEFENGRERFLLRDVESSPLLEVVNPSREGLFVRGVIGVPDER